MYSDFFDLFFTDMTNIALNWNRNGFKEKDGYTILPEKNGNGFIIVFNTVGVAANDIKVYHSTEGKKTYIKVNGNTKIPEMNDQVYATNYEISFLNCREIEDVQYKVRDGFTIVYVKTKKPDVQPTKGISAKNIADDDDFEW